MDKLWERIIILTHLEVFLTRLDHPDVPWRYPDVILTLS